MSNSDQDPSKNHPQAERDQSKKPPARKPPPPPSASDPPNQDTRPDSDVGWREIFSRDQLQAIRDNTTHTLANLGKLISFLGFDKAVSAVVKEVCKACKDADVPLDSIQEMMLTSLFTNRDESVSWWSDFFQHVTSLQPVRKQIAQRQQTWPPNHGFPPNNPVPSMADNIGRGHQPMMQPGVPFDAGGPPAYRYGHLGSLLDQGASSYRSSMMPLEGQGQQQAGLKSPFPAPAAAAASTSAPSASTSAKSSSK